MKEPEPKETQGAASAAWQLFCQTGLPEAYLVRHRKGVRRALSARRSSLT